MKPNTIAGTTISGQIHVRRFKPYPAYKDSGIEWLGKVPEGWPIKRLRFAADINNVGKNLI